VATERKRPSSNRAGRKRIVKDSVPKILVVEDDTDLGEGVCELLSVSGYRAMHAVDGIAALDALGKGYLPDLILLDLMMPRMDGWEFREAMLNDKRLKSIPVVVFSAAGQILKPIEADHVLRKPVAPETLLAAVKSLVRSRV
jgi:two-component system, chemotaxis family, chemotaxis protein CheY